MKRSFKISSLSAAGLFLGVLLASGAGWGASDDFRYDSHGKRDPFMPLVGQETPALLKLEEIKSVEEIKLEGIATGAGGQRIAVMNGEFAKEGDRAGDIEIMKISESAVTLSIGGRVYTVTLPEGEGGA